MYGNLDTVEAIECEKYINIKNVKKSDIDRSICDFIAGMTDRYAINLYEKIK